MTSSVLTQNCDANKENRPGAYSKCLYYFHNFRLEKEEEEQWEVSSYSFIIARYFVHNNSDRAL